MKIYLVMSLFIVLLFLPQSSLAYKTTEQTATLINKNTILFTITYSFNFLNRDAYMPIVASYDFLGTTTIPHLNYEILKGEDIYSQGQIKALVLSKAKIEDGKYFLPAGQKTEFKFISFLTLPNNISEVEKELILRITKLPITFRKDDGSESYSELGLKELELYKTPSIGL